MEVHGIDPETRGYRVSVVRDGARIAGLVPETLVGPRPPHHDVYAWIGRHQGRIETALADLAAGRTPRAPYDQLRLAED